ncbi:MAG: hypothetical protein RLZZ387_1282 [Chloroflexota bacterium]
MTPPVTLEELAWLDRCQRRLWLDRNGDTAERVPPARDAVARTEANRTHARRVVAALAGVTPVPEGTWEDRLAATLELVRAGTPLIAWAALEAPVGGVVLRSPIHLLRRTADRQAPSGYSYQPVDIRLHAEPTRWDRSRIDGLRWLVGAALAGGCAPPGELWLGANGAAPARVYARHGDVRALGATLAGRHAGVVAGAEPAIWFDSDHCPFCPWRDACDRVALGSQDLATLPGLRRSHARALRHSGVTAVPQVATLSHAQLAALPDSDGTIARALQAHAESLQSGRPVSHVSKRSEPAGAGDGVLFLDIETDPLTRVPWAIGWMGLDGVAVAAVVAPVARPRQVSIAGVAVTLVRTPAQAWQLAADAVGGPVIHWGDAEMLLLARSGAARARAVVGPWLLDLHAVISSDVALPIPRLSTRRSAGLKAVAGWLGYSWPEGADHWADGWVAYQGWRAARRGRRAGAAQVSPGVLAPAMAYLRSDLDALAVVWRWYRAFRDDTQAPTCER